MTSQLRVSIRDHVRTFYDTALFSKDWSRYSYRKNMAKRREP